MGVDLGQCLNLPSTATFFARSGRCKGEGLSYCYSLVLREQLEPC